MTPEDIALFVSARMDGRIIPYPFKDIDGYEVLIVQGASAAGIIVKTPEEAVRFTHI